MHDESVDEEAGAVYGGAAIAERRTQSKRTKGYATIVLKGDISDQTALTSAARRLPMAWLLPTRDKTTRPTIRPSITTTTMPRRRNKKAERYDSHEEKISKAIHDLKENPKVKLKHIAACHGPNRKTL